LHRDPQRIHRVTQRKKGRSLDFFNSPCRKEIQFKSLRVNLIFYAMKTSFLNPPLLENVIAPIMITRQITPVTNIPTDGCPGFW
jgi:hypothetical protein